MPTPLSGKLSKHQQIVVVVVDAMFTDYDVELIKLTCNPPQLWATHTHTHALCTPQFVLFKLQIKLVKCNLRPLSDQLTPAPFTVSLTEVLTCLDLAVLPCVLSCPALSCLVLSHPVLSCRLLTCAAVRVFMNLIQ